ncbi:MAG TPA: helix-turn-helix domain-containing protein [Gaiellaceae bacterium]|nr:helix-turn-helix domain-containing protein [Gaiellaceae bacterium]
MKPETPSAAGETIGQRLKRLRLERGLSQRELAAPGVSYAYISRIEAGTRQPSVKALRKLAAKLGVSADFLESGSELDPESARELRLADLELAVRLGDGDGGEEALRQVLEQAEAAADAHCAFRARVALAAVLEDRNDLAGAIDLLEGAVAQEFAQPSEHVDVYSQLGRAYAGVGRTAQAVELFEQCLERCADSPSAEARFALMLSYALTDAGEIARAEDVVRSALARTRASEDPYMRVRLYWSMARLAEAEGRASIALANIRKAIALLETTEDGLNLARAHTLASRLLIEREKADEASAHLDRAERLFGVSPAVSDLAEVRIQRSRIARILGDAPAAIAFAREALTIESQPADRGHALAALADGLALEGESDPANEAYREAVDILEREGRWRAAANTCRTWGSMLRTRGMGADAFDVLDRAAELGMRATPQHARTER